MVPGNRVVASFSLGGVSVLPMAHEREHRLLAAYFLPVIEEVLELRISPDYFQYLRRKVQRILPNPQAAASRPRRITETRTRTPSTWMMAQEALPFLLPFTPCVTSTERCFILAGRRRWRIRPPNQVAGRRQKSAFSTTVTGTARW
jgi:hypothetical protein